MENNTFSDITSWYDQLWQNNRKSDFIKEIQSRLASETDKIRIDALKHVLRFEFVRLEKFAAAMELLEKKIEDDPNDSETRVRVAEDLLYYSQNLQKALEKIELALPLAKATHKFERHALQVKARILRARGDYQNLETCLREIMAFTHTEGQLDVGKESDFLKNLPDGVISEGLLKEFNRYLLNKKSAD